MLFSRLRKTKSDAPPAHAGPVDYPFVMPGPRELLLQKLPQIERIVAAICRRSGMDTDATEEFTAEVKLRLVENDYAVLRAFQNRSSFPVYIGAVVKRMLIDHRNREWGKWRASAEAERLGPLAIDLERLLYRDWCSLADAAATLAAKSGTTREEIDGLAARIPARQRRRKVGLDEAETVAARPMEADAVRESTARRISKLITAFIDRLPEDDQLLLRLHFDSDMTVAQIARALQLDQQRVYRRLYKRFEELRSELSRAGVSKSDVTDLIGTEVAGLDFGLKKRGVRPSPRHENDERPAEARQEEVS